MKKQNRWVHGQRNFILPPPPSDQKGRKGCKLLQTTFDQQIGDETYVLFMEDPKFSDQYSNISPFKLLAHCGLVRTPHGIVAFIVWQLAAGSSQEIMVEQYLNP